MAELTGLGARIGRSMPRVALAPPRPLPAQFPGDAAAVRRLAPLAVVLLALWPHGRWMALRMVDGSDEPWGVLALVTVLALVAREYGCWRAPRPGALLAAGALSLIAALALWVVPPLCAAALGMLALAVLLADQVPRRSATPLLTLLLLALPVIASLQFYLGFPLRVLTAALAAPVLRLVGIDAHAAGATLLFDGRIVLVDAPCAGLAMLWLGSYTAALLSWLQDARARRTLANGLVAAGLVFLANVLRNVVLFFPESGLVTWPGWSHDAVGLAAFAFAIAPAIAFALAAGPAIALEQSRARAGSPLVDTPPARDTSSPVSHLSFVGACLLAAVVPALARVLPASTTGTLGTSVAPVLRHVEWPTHFRGRPLTQLALTPLDARFAARFPGAIARFSDGQQILIARSVGMPTRMLHPAADCFRAAGYAITAPRAAVDEERTRWNCFEAQRPGEARLRVCERIDNAAGLAWTDVSAWYWAALRSTGPWRAWTVVTPLGARG